MSICIRQLLLHGTDECILSSIQYQQKSNILFGSFVLS